MSDGQNEGAEGKIQKREREKTRERVWKRKRDYTTFVWRLNRGRNLFALWIILIAFESKIDTIYDINISNNIRKQTVAILVMHLLLVRVLEGLAVATVSVKAPEGLSLCTYCTGLSQKEGYTYRRIKLSLTCYSDCTLWQLEIFCLIAAFN